MNKSIGINLKTQTKIVRDIKFKNAYKTRNRLLQ